MTSSTDEQGAARPMDEAQARKVSDQQLRQRAIGQLPPEYQAALQNASGTPAVAFRSLPDRPIFSFFLERATKLPIDLVNTGPLQRYTVEQLEKEAVSHMLDPQQLGDLPRKQEWAAIKRHDEEGRRLIGNDSLPVPKPFRQSMPDEWNYFRKEWGRFLGDETDDDLTELRDELRWYWEHGPEALVYLATRLLVRPHAPGTNRLWKFKLRRGGVLTVPPLFDLPRALAYAILDLAPRLGFCANPDCRSPYFLKGRRTQRFCDRPDCVRFGQRQYKKNWWEKRGKEWRASRRRKKSKRDAK